MLLKNIKLSIGIKADCFDLDNIANSPATNLTLNTQWFDRHSQSLPHVMNLLKCAIELILY